eukprot:5410409-Alexandrium_andersonii.AAC.1
MCIRDSCFSDRVSSCGSITILHPTPSVHQQVCNSAANCSQQVRAVSNGLPWLSSGAATAIPDP